MTADTRGFVYRLEALRQRSDCELDAALQRLSQSRQSLDELVKQRERLQSQHNGLAQAARAVTGSQEAWALRATRTTFLVELGLRIAALDGQLGVARSAQDHALAEVSRLRLRREALERHREQALEAHVATLRRRQANADDQDWLARSSWRASVDPRERRTRVERELEVGR